MAPGAQENRFRALFAPRRACPLVIAHRGASAHAPENTLEAAQLGHRAGADAWECDVHLTRDGVPIVIHDETLVRTTDVARKYADDARQAAGFRVADFDLDELQALDAGSWFVDPGGGARSVATFGTLESLSLSQVQHYRSGSIRVPTLAEALRLTDQLDWLVNVELKSFPEANPRLVDAVLGVIDETQTASRVLVSSFDHAELARVMEVCPHVATGVLTSTPLYRPEAYVRNALGCDAYHPSAYAVGSGSDAYLRAPSARHLRIDDLARLEARGVPVLVFTVNDSRPDGLAAHLAECGVTGLFSDEPSALHRLFG
jgi:glycerophosphoryl diester phosphodiesterase